MTYEDGLSDFIAAVKEEAARYGFVNFPLTDEELEYAYNEGLEVSEMYGVVCDVSAGLSFEEALGIASDWWPEAAVSGAVSASATVSADARPESIDVTPTWTDILPVFRSILEDGSAESQAAIWEEIERMAKLADLYVASLSPDPAVGEEVV